MGDFLACQFFQALPVKLSYLAVGVNGLDAHVRSAGIEVFVDS